MKKNKKNVKVGAEQQTSVGSATTTSGRSLPTREALATALIRIARLEEEVAMCLRYIRIQAERNARAIDPSFRPREGAKA